MYINTHLRDLDTQPYNSDDQKSQPRRLAREREVNYKKTTKTRIMWEFNTVLLIEEKINQQLVFMPEAAANMWTSNRLNSLIYPNIDHDHTFTIFIPLNLYT